MVEYAKPTIRRHTMRNKQKQDFWQTHISECSKSKISQGEYCRRHNLAKSTFGYWKRKLAEHSHTVKFYPLVVQKEKGGPEESCVSLFISDRRFQLEIGAGFSATTLKQVVVALESI